MVRNLICRVNIVYFLFGILSQTVFAGGMDSQHQECPKERGAFCMELYEPVCAIRDTGIRCIKAPCPSTENVTFSNSCKACADVKVYGYQSGACLDLANDKKQEDSNNGQ